jgi:hypothetical protein
MRLINARSMKLEDFTAEAPEYAILSHTWSDGEVSLQEFIQCPEGGKEGYSKITSICRVALDEGIEYCWVDTCCIDKTSSAELVEAINSMFNWYQRAKVCFAYLSDLDLNKDSEESVATRVGRCRWFTRGWCLQELIAPKDLRFYDCYWRLVSTKKSLRISLSQMTSIDQDVLENSSRMYTKPIARRMSWAAKRQTTRVEDIAYSLLGIFDVNMPLLYGEGEKAFGRLQEEIIKKSNDLSIFAWKPSSSDRKKAYLNMFASSPASFGGCNISDGEIVNGAPSRSLFSLSNRGIQFTAVDLAVLKAETNQEGPDYVLPLYCMSTENNKTYRKNLLLKKIGPGLFVRSSMSGDRVVTTSTSERPWTRPWTIENEIYVLSRMIPDFDRVIDAAHSHSFEIKTSAPQLSIFSIQGLEPRDAWDCPRSRFLTQGDSSFTGFVKVYPEISSIQTSHFFVVALSFRRVGESLEPSICLVHPDVWSVYDAPGRTLAWMVKSAVEKQVVLNKKDKLDELKLNLPLHNVTAEVHTKTSRGCPVFKVILDWKLKTNWKREYQGLEDKDWLDPIAKFRSHET